jgi:hypothetical protein
MMSLAEKVPFTEPRVWLQHLDEGLDALMCVLPVSQRYWNGLRHDVMPVLS